MLLPRERIENAINHKIVDQIPRDLGGLVSGISKIAYDRLVKHLNLKIESSKISDRVQQLAQIDEKVLKKFNIDCRHVRVKFSNSNKQNSSFTDSYGIKFQKVGTIEHPVLYYEMVHYPLAQATDVSQITNFNFPTPRKEWFNGCRKEAKSYWDNGFAVVANPLSGGILEQTIWLRGFENFIIDLYANREMIEELLNQNMINQINIWDKWLEEVGEWTTIVLYGDDYGNQDRVLLHPNMWRELVKPRVKELVHHIKTNFPDIKVQLHSCGSIEQIIPDLIDIGFDILNPIQPRAIGMDHKVLKAKYGSKLCFHGGFDIQQVLPRGKLTEIDKEVDRLIKSLYNDKTGYIFATAHNILADVPPENIIQIYQRLDQLNRM